MPPHTNRNMTGGRQRQRQRPTKRQRIETIKERKNRKLSFVSEGKQSTHKTKKNVIQQATTMIRSRRPKVTRQNDCLAPNQYTHAHIRAGDDRWSALNTIISIGVCVCVVCVCTTTISNKNPKRIVCVKEAKNGENQDWDVRLGLLFFVAFLFASTYTYY